MRRKQQLLECLRSVLSSKAVERIGIRPHVRSRRKMLIESLERREVFDAGWASAQQGAVVSDMIGDAAGNTYVTGALQSPTVVIGNNTYSDTGGKLYVAKSDSSGQVLWVRQFSGDSEQYSRGIDLDSAGNVVIVGGFENSGQFGAQTLISAGGRDAFVAKLNGSDGQFLWAQSIGGALYDLAWDTVFDSAGDVVVSGGFDAADFSNLYNTPIMFVSKLAGSNGAAVWTSEVNVTGGSYLQDLSVDPAGAIYANGKLDGTADFPSGSVSSTGGTLITKLDSSGNWLWAQALAGDTSAYVNGSTVGPDGQLYIVGQFRGTVQYGAIPMTSAGESDGFVARINSQTGVPDWGRRFGGSTSDNANQIQMDSLGRLNIVGSFTGTADFGAETLSTAPVTAASVVANGFLSTLDSSGNFLDAHRIVSLSKGGVIMMNGLNIDATGAIYVSGVIPATGVVAQFPQQELTLNGGSGMLPSNSFAVKLPPAAATKFFVADDGVRNRTYQYAASGALTIDNFIFNSGNTAPRGAASTAAGTKVWVVDANKTVYVYSASGDLLGSWTVGGLTSTAQIEGITTNGTDIWLVDAKQDKVFKYSGAASRLSGNQNAASSFNLNSANKDPKDLVTDGASIWVVNNSTTDKVFKYSMTGALVGSWTISTPGATSPTGITLNPASPSALWIVDNGTDKIYQYDAAVGRTSGSQAASTTFVLAVGNTNPQGIADPPVPGSDLSTTADSTAVALEETAAISSQQPNLNFPSYLPPSVITSNHSVTQVVMESWDGQSAPLVTTLAHIRPTAVSMPNAMSEQAPAENEQFDEAIEQISDELELRGSVGKRKFRV